MTSSVDGLVTGMDTTTIISQLMQLEAAPQTRLKGKVAAQQSEQSALQSINARMLAVRTAAEALTTAASWQAIKGTTSSDAVTVTTGTGGSAGDVMFDVIRLAKAHVMMSTVPASGSQTTAGKVTLTVGGVVKPDITVTVDTPQGLADAINTANVGVRATVLTTTTGQVLQFSASGTGVAKAFSVAGITNAATVLTAGVDAEVSIGAAAAGGPRLTSATNTFTGLMPGVTITANRVQADVVVSAVRDSGKLADAMQTLVSAVNSASAAIAGASGYNATSKTSGPLNGNGLVRGLRAELVRGVTGSAGTTGIGVKLDKAGSLGFDRAAFIAAYEANPTAVQTSVSAGFAANYKAIAISATDATIGRITLAVQGGDSSLRRMNAEIGDWDVRLAGRKVTLQRSYAALETALGRLKNQSSWLSSQLASLPSSS